MLHPRILSLAVTLSTVFVSLMRENCTNVCRLFCELNELYNWLDRKELQVKTIVNSSKSVHVSRELKKLLKMKWLSCLMNDKDVELSWEACHIVKTFSMYKNTSLQVFVKYRFHESPWIENDMPTKWMIPSSKSAARHEKEGNIAVILQRLKYPLKLYNCSERTRQLRHYKFLTKCPWSDHGVSLSLSLKASKGRCSVLIIESFGDSIAFPRLFMYWTTFWRKWATKQTRNQQQCTPDMISWQRWWWWWSSRGR